MSYFYQIDQSARETLGQKNISISGPAGKHQTYFVDFPKGTILLNENRTRTDALTAPKPLVGCDFYELPDSSLFAYNGQSLFVPSEREIIWLQKERTAGRTLEAELEV